MLPINLPSKTLTFCTVTCHNNQTPSSLLAKTILMYCFTFRSVLYAAKDNDWQWVKCGNGTCTAFHRTYFLFLNNIYCTYIRGRQSPTRLPNPACEFSPSGPRRLVSFNIKFGPENVPNDERLFSCWAWFSRTLITSDTCGLTHRCWLTPFTLDPSVTSLVKLEHFWWSWKK